MGFGKWVRFQQAKKETDFIFLGFQITSDYDCSHNIKRHLLLGRKATTNLHIEIRDITLLTKVQIVKAIVFPCMDMRVGP